MAKNRWSSIKAGDVAVVICSAETVSKTSSDIVKYYTKTKKYNCVYVSVSRPWNSLKKTFEKVGAETKNIFYIDCATPLISGMTGIIRTKEAAFVHPSHLTNLSIMISKLTKNNKDEKIVLVFDALSTLIIYSNENLVARFMHVLATKIRESEIDGVIFTVEEEMKKEFKSRVMQLSDLRVKVK